jgi:hypothetical protein
MSPLLRLGLVLAASFGVLGCNEEEPEVRVSAEEAILERKCDGLEALIAAAEKGRLLPFEQVLVVVEQGLVQELLNAAMPFERVIEDKYRIRVTGAKVEFDDGFALVRLVSRASFAGRDESEAYAEVEVYGGLDVVELDPVSGLLRGRVRLMGVEARRVDVMGMATPAERLVEDLSRERIESFEALASSVEIPVRLESSITIPAVGPEGRISIERADIPMKVEIRDVKAFRDRLWVSLQASASAK